MGKEVGEASRHNERREWGYRVGVASVWARTSYDSMNRRGEMDTRMVGSGEYSDYLGTSDSMSQCREADIAMHAPVKSAQQQHSDLYTASDVDGNVKDKAVPAKVALSSSLHVPGM